MNFTRISQYRMVSDCNRYSVTAVCSMGEWAFFAYRDNPAEGKQPTPLAPPFATSEEARRCCERDAEQRVAA